MKIISILVISLIFSLNLNASLEKTKIYINNNITIKEIKVICNKIITNSIITDNISNNSFEIMINKCINNITKKPLDQNLRYSLAILYESSGKREKAINELKRISLIDKTTFISLNARKLLNTLEFLNTL